MLGTVIPAENCDTCPETQDVYLRLVAIPNDDPQGPPNKGSVDMAFCQSCRNLWDERDEAFCAKAQLVIDAKFARKMQRAKREVPRYISTDLPIFMMLHGVTNRDTIDEVQAALYDEWRKGKTAVDDSDGLTMHFMLYTAIEVHTGEPLPPLSNWPIDWNARRQQEIATLKEALLQS